MKRYILIFLIIVLAGTVYLTNFFIKKERSFEENLRLKQENENLKAQIQLLKVNSQKSTVNNNFITAKVFSAYPFNIKNQITINAGKNQGIEKLMVVTISENILVGQIIEVYKNSSLVRTIFDPDWQLPVRIGEEGIDGLFQGGGEPRVILIEKEKPLQLNDVVYSASQEFPYSLKIGEIAEIKESAAGVFKEALLKMPFNVSELREVNVLTK